MEQEFEFYTDEHISKLQNFIIQNYKLDATSKQLIKNILQYVAAQEDDASIILDMLEELLDGVGITRDDIVKAVCE